MEEQIWNQQFEALKGSDGREGVLHAARENGFVLQDVLEKHELASEIPHGADRIYFFVLMKRFEESLRERLLDALQSIRLSELDEELFKLIDTDEDDSISYEEIERFLNS